MGKKNGDTHHDIISFFFYFITNLRKIIPNFSLRKLIIADSVTICQENNEIKAMLTHCTRHPAGRPRPGRWPATHCIQ